jgi:hypothetical protein
MAGAVCGFPPVGHGLFADVAGQADLQVVGSLVVEGCGQFPIKSLGEFPLPFPDGLGRFLAGLLGQKLFLVGFAASVEGAAALGFCMHSLFDPAGPCVP